MNSLSKTHVSQFLKPAEKCSSVQKTVSVGIATPLIVDDAVTLQDFTLQDMSQDTYRSFACARDGRQRAAIKDALTAGYLSDKGTKYLPIVGSSGAFWRYSMEKSEPEDLPSRLTREDLIPLTGQIGGRSQIIGFATPDAFACPLERSDGVIVAFPVVQGHKLLGYLPLATNHNVPDRLVYQGPHDGLTRRDDGAYLLVEDGDDIIDSQDSENAFALSDKTFKLDRNVALDEIETTAQPAARYAPVYDSNDRVVAYAQKNGAEYEPHAQTPLPGNCAIEMQNGRLQVVWTGLFDPEDSDWENQLPAVLAPNDDRQIVPCASTGHFEVDAPDQGLSEFLGQLSSDENQRRIMMRFIEKSNLLSQFIPAVAEAQGARNKNTALAAGMLVSFVIVIAAGATLVAHLYRQKQDREDGFDLAQAVHDKIVECLKESPHWRSVEHAWEYVLQCASDLLKMDRGHYVRTDIGQSVNLEDVAAVPCPEASMTLGTFLERMKGEFQDAFVINRPMYSSIGRLEPVSAAFMWMVVLMVAGIAGLLS